MTAWSGGPPVPVRYTRDASPLQRQGAIIFQSKQCRNCHSIAGEGGQRGPALDLVASRMTEDQLIRQVLQGGGNMPAYGKNLSPSEVTALVGFLETLHPINEPPAADASRTAAATRVDHWIVPPVTSTATMLAGGAKLIDRGGAK